MRSPYWIYLVDGNKLLGFLHKRVLIASYGQQLFIQFIGSVAVARGSVRSGRTQQRQGRSAGVEETFRTGQRNPAKPKARLISPASSRIGFASRRLLGRRLFQSDRLSQKFQRLLLSRETIREQSFEQQFFCLFGFEQRGDLGIADSSPVLRGLSEDRLLMRAAVLWPDSGRPDERRSTRGQGVHLRLVRRECRYLSLPRFNHMSRAHGFQSRGGTIITRIFLRVCSARSIQSSERSTLPS